MSVNKNVNVCVATSPGLLINVDANHTGQKVGLLNRAAQTAYVYRARRNDRQDRGEYTPNGRAERRLGARSR
jgi:hypothetical protein